MFTLYAKVEGHELKWVDTPALASGSIDADVIRFEFDDSWSNYSKVALFWMNDADDPIGVVVDSQGYATIPYEALSEKARIRIGVYGKPSGSSTPRITSTLLGYSIERGAWSDSIANTGTVTPTLIEQFEAAATEAIAEAAELLEEQRTKGTVYFQENAHGKNLFNAYSEQNEDGKYLTLYGNVSSGSTYSGLSHYMPVKAGQTYYINTGTTESSSRYCCFYDENMNPINMPSSDNPGHNAQANPVVTAPAGAVAMRFTYRIATRYTDVQVEEGSTKTSHEPYISDAQAYELGVGAAEAHGQANYEVRGEPNLFNQYSRDNIVGYYLNNGTMVANESYGVSHHIPVTQTRFYLFGCGMSISSTRQTSRNVCRWAFYDQYGQLLLGGTGWAAQAPLNAVSMRISYLLAVIDEVIVEEYAPQNENLFNAYSQLNEDLVYVRWTGTSTSESGIRQLVNSNDSWGMSHFIPVTAGSTYRFCYTGSSASTTGPRIMVFDASFSYILSGVNPVELYDDNHRSLGYWWTITIPANGAWVRVPYAVARRYSLAELSKGGSAPSAYVAYKGATVGFGEKCMAYLPDYIYCAIGRTIDIYNSQVVLNPEWYNVRWVCETGYAYKRKFSVTGTNENVGDHELTLYVYDKSGRAVYNKTATLVVATGIVSNKSMLMIGDSLTKADKPVLAELVNLSSGRLTPVGREHQSATDAGGTTRECYSEAISGKSPLWFVSNSASPFYDGSKFSWNYYKHHDGVSDVSPNFITIMLGTNGYGENPKRQAAYIAQIVSNIHDDDPNIKILVCHTIYRSNQDGIAVQTGTDGFSTGTVGAFKRIEDEKIMGLMMEIDKAIAGMSNTYAVSVAVSMDAEYNFGGNEVDVNPRNPDFKEYRPVESIHPQSSGYYQIADIIYSAISALI